ncbi:hypothetical protein Hanom_Chr12g01098801 [Helianthus anomalus]
MPHAQLGTDPWSVSVSLFLLWGCYRGVGHVTFILSICIYIGFGCLFAHFVLLCSLGLVNSKGRKKHAFSNICA